MVPMQDEFSYLITLLNTLYCPKIQVISLNFAIYPYFLFFSSQLLRNKATTAKPTHSSGQVNSRLIEL